mmetsp:Transcript_32390/g.54171  ORF Transcript_32390/g.54171 Transcript_32390/m.54171 type:complete len:82 (-) Transcript_32390:24-269(-)
MSVNEEENEQLLLLLMLLGLDEGAGTIDASCISPCGNDRIDDDDDDEEEEEEDDDGGCSGTGADALSEFDRFRNNGFDMYR